MKVPAPNLEYTMTKTDSGFDIEISTDKLAKNVYLQTQEDAGFFSDNYFDMLPGETRIISLKTELNENELNEMLTVRSLDDAF